MDQVLTPHWFKGQKLIWSDIQLIIHENAKYNFHVFKYNRKHEIVKRNKEMTHRFHDISTYFLEQP